jgi:hypothetical protein
MCCIGLTNNAALLSPGSYNGQTVAIYANAGDDCGLVQPEQTTNLGPPDFDDYYWYCDPEGLVIQPN